MTELEKLQADNTALREALQAALTALESFTAHVETCDLEPSDMEAICKARKALADTERRCRMSATPRTDKQAKRPGHYVCEAVPARFARQLELENQELREALNYCADYHRHGNFDFEEKARAALARSGKEGA